MIFFLVSYPLHYVTDVAIVKIYVQFLLLKRNVMYFKDAKFQFFFQVNMSNSNTPFMMDEQELLRPSNEENSSNQHLVLHESPSTSTQEPLGITIHYPATSNTMASSTNIVRELQEKNGNMAEQSTIIIEPMEVMDSIDMHTIESNSHQRDKKNASIIPAYEFKTTSSNIVENVSESEKIAGTILSYPPSNKVPSINLLSKISRKSSIGGSVPYTITMVSDKTKEQPHRIFEQSSLENSLEKNNSNKTFHTKKIKLNLSDFNDLPKKKIKEEGKFEEYSAGYHGNSKAKVPGPGTIARLAPNATLIDLNKIKRDKQNNIPLLIDQVTVMIDDTNNVKVSKKKCMKVCMKKLRTTSAIKYFYRNI